MNYEKLKIEHQRFLNKVRSWLIKNEFQERQAINLLDSRFGYPFSPSAGHNIIDEIVISKEEEVEVIKWCVVPDKSIRMYDVEKIGISSRHLSFFESIPFGYAGSGKLLPGEESVETYFEFLTKALGLDKDKIIVTILDSCEAEGIKLDEQEDAIFRITWESLLGKEKVFATSGRRNLFYSRIQGNPGGTGQEIYYKIGNKFIEIGSAVNYKFRYIGHLKRTVNQAIIQGVGLERVFMALENKENIFETSLFTPLRETIIKFLTIHNSKDPYYLYGDNINKISDFIRAISFIVNDGQELDKSKRGAILKKFIKQLHSEFVYLGINKEKSELLDELLEAMINLFSARYPSLGENKAKILDTIKSVSAS